MWPRLITVRCSLISCLDRHLLGISLYIYCYIVAVDVLQQEPGIPVKAFAQVLQRLGCDQIADTPEPWYLYSINVVAHLCGDHRTPVSVTLARFARIVAWFGPLERKHFLLRVAWLFSRMCAFNSDSS